MSLEKIGQPTLFNSTYLGMKGRQWLVHKIKLEPIWLVQKWIVLEKTYRNCLLVLLFGAYDIISHILFLPFSI